MRQAFLGGSYQKVLILQAIGTLMFALGTLVLGGQQMAMSVLAGGTIIMVGNLAYAWIARPSRVFAKSGNEVLLRHVLAQIAKLVMILGLMLGAFTSGWFQTGWLLVAMGVALLGHWVSLFR